MKHRKPFVIDKEMLELTDEVREVILREEKRYTIKEFIEDEEKHKQVLLRASVLGAFDQTVNHILYKIRAMEKLSDEEIDEIELMLYRYFVPKDYRLDDEPPTEAKSLEDIENIESI
jgi:hypothetical protein